MRTKLWLTCLTIFFLMGLWVAPVVAQEAVTAKMVKAKVEEAAKYVAEKGESAFPEMSDAKSKWANEPYIFVHNLSGVIVAQPIQQGNIGKNMLAGKDVKGNLFRVEFVNVAKGIGHGWVEYWWPKPGEQEASQKVSYIMKVPGKDFLVGSGIYGYSKEKAIAEAGD